MGLLTLILLLFYCSADVKCQECSSVKLADTDVLETVEVYNNEFAIDDDRVSYEIAPSAPSNSFDQISDPVRILTNNNSTCPTSCTVTLNRYIDSFQGNQSTVLFFDSEHSFYLPSHYIKDNATSFICATSNGYCGATIPVYRYYKISNGGVFHAYSFNQGIMYDGYNQEFLPICYAWTVATGTVAARPTCGTLNFDTPLSALSDLKIYDNYVDGIERDHYYTTLPSTDASLVGYNQTGVLGKVLTSSKSTACSCLVKLQQQFDNQTGYFHRLDHKLIVTGQEQNRPYEEYIETGEAMYCAKRLGDCGATLPLWKHFQFYDIDTVYTTDSSPLPMSYLYPQVPLCYIWPASYAPNMSNIPTVPPSQAPEVTLSPTGSPGTTWTTGSSTVSHPGSTPLMDGGGVGGVGGVTPMLVTISTAPTLPTGSTISPLYPATTPSMPIGSANSTPTVAAGIPAATGPTMSPLYPASTSAGTMGTGSTMSPLYPASTLPTLAGGTIGTGTPGTAATGSTMSPLYPASPTTSGTVGTGSTMSPLYPASTMPTMAGGTIGTGTPGTAATGSTMSPLYPASPTTLGTVGTGPTMSPLYPASPSTPGTSATGSTMSPLYPASPTTSGTAPTVSVWGTTALGNTAPTVSVWGTTNTPSGASQSTVSVWGTATPTTHGTAPTVSAWGTTSMPSGASQSTVSVWGTASPTTPGTAPTISVWGTGTPTTHGTAPTISVWGTTPSPSGSQSTVSVWGTNTPTTYGTGPTVSGGHLSDPGAATFMPVNPVTATGKPLVTEANMDTEAPFEEEGPGSHSPETFTLSDFWYLNATTVKPGTAMTLVPTAPTAAVTHGASASSGSPSSNGSVTSIEPGSVSTGSPGTTAPPAPTMAMITGPLNFNNPPMVTAAPVASGGSNGSSEISGVGATTVHPAASEGTTGAPGTSGTSAAAGGAPTTVHPVDPSATTLAPGTSMAPTTPHPAVTESSNSTTNGTISQHVAQAPTYSIVGGPLNQITNPPIIEALISSFNQTASGSVFTSASTMSSESSQAVVKRDTSSSSSPAPLMSSTVSGASASSSASSPAPTGVPGTSTESPGIIWKAGDWISNTWHSVFGGGDQKPSNTSTTASSLTMTTTTTSKPLGGLVGSMINSTGNFFNDTKTFIGNTLGGSSSSNSSSNPISNFLNNTGNVIGQALSSNGTGGTFLNNTKNWIDDKLDSTGEFLSNAWNSLGSSNDTTGSFLNNTKTWVGGAMNSTGNFISSAWNETKEHSGTFLNTSQTWIGDQLNGTAVGGLVNDAKDLVGSAGEAINGFVGGSNSTVNGTSIAAAPLSNAVGSVATAILTSASNSSSTVAPADVKIEWNGGRVDGPLTG